MKIFSQITLEKYSQSTKIQWEFSKVEDSDDEGNDDEGNDDEDDELEGSAAPPAPPRSPTPPPASDGTCAIALYE